MLTPVGIEPPRVIDLHGIAELIDTILGTAPERLGTLLRTLSTSDERLEARVVVELALRCRDPLAPLSSLCRDALKAASDLDVLLALPKRRRVKALLRFGHVNAMLNLCDVALRQVSSCSGKRRQRIQEILPRVKAAAVAEKRRRRGEIERFRRARQAALPDLWRLFEAYLDGGKARGVSRV